MEKPYISVYSYFSHVTGFINDLHINFNNFQMTRYKQAEFEDDDSSSIGSIALNSERISTSATHIRYHTVSTFQITY